MVRDFLNYTLDRSVIENARIIIESDYKTVQKKIEYLIKRFKKWINDVPEHNSKEEGVIVLDGNNIHIFSCGHEVLTGELIKRSFFIEGINMPQ